MSTNSHVKCPLCSNTSSFNDLKSLYDRLKNPMFQCPVTACGFAVDSLLQLTEHLTVVHLASDTIDVASSSNGDTRIFELKQDEPPPQPPAMLPFSMSPSSPNKISLPQQHHQFQCSNCSKTFRTEASLAIHTKMTHLTSPSNTCPTCLKTFTTKYFLKKHIRLHTGETPYRCDECDKSFTFQQSYHKHRQYHSGEKRHECTDCKRTFKEPGTLQNHRRIHTGEKPFVCEQCAKPFRQRIAYLVHKRIHSGQMPYSCTACGRKFRYRVSLRAHRCEVVADSGADLVPKTTADCGRLLDTMIESNDFDVDSVTNEFFNRLLFE